MKQALWVASLLLVAGTATACGGDDAPSDASKEDFCATATDIAWFGPRSRRKDFAEKLEDVGTPDDMSDDERKGFDLFIETANKLDDDATEEDVAQLGEDLSDDDEKNLQAFTTYLTETCAKELAGPARPTCPRTTCPRTSYPRTTCPRTAPHGRPAHEPHVRTPDLAPPRSPSIPSPADLQMKKALWAASLLAGCLQRDRVWRRRRGGAPEQASVEEFCEPFKELKADTKPDELADQLKDADSEGHPGRCPHGFEFLIDNAEDLDKNSETLDDEQAFKDKYGDEEFAEVEAFIEDCGDDGGGAPEEASVEEFCKPFTDAQADADAKVADVADELKEVGTPKDIPDDARKGFEFLIDNAEDLDKNSDDLDDEEAFKDKYGDEEFAQIEAFIEYLAKTCVPELPDVPRPACPRPDDAHGRLPTDECPRTLPNSPTTPSIPESS